MASFTESAVFQHMKVLKEAGSVSVYDWQRRTAKNILETDYFSRTAYFLSEQINLAVREIILMKR